MGSNNPYLLDVKPFFVLFPFFSPFLLSNLGKCPSRPFFHSSLLLLLPLEKAAQELCLCQMWQHFITSLLSGLGAGLFFFRRPVFLNTTAEASPFTNVTIDTTNTNNPQNNSKSDSHPDFDEHEQRPGHKHERLGQHDHEHGEHGDGEQQREEEEESEGAAWLVLG